MSTEKNNVVNMAAIVKKWVDLVITVADQTYSQTLELDKTIAFVKGILVACNKPELSYYRGSQKIEINRQEVFPEGYASMLLMSGINCPMNSRYYDTGNMPIGNGQVKVTYKDVTNSRAAFEPYVVTIHLDCELKEY